MLMRLVPRRDAGIEWTEINALLRVANPANPRDFAGNLAQAIAPEVLDFKNDALPQVDDIDDLYQHRGDVAVRQYIDRKLAKVGYEAFVALMPLKLRIDAEWAEINRLLDRAGQRQGGVLTWRLEPSDPTSFDTNLAKALEGQRPPVWPWGASRSMTTRPASARSRPTSPCRSAARSPGRICRADRRRQGRGLQLERC